MIRFVYAEQFGAYWRFTPDEWRAFVIEAIKNDACYTLPKDRESTRRPRYIGAEKWGDGEKSLYSKSPEVARVVSPLDWDKTDFESELSDLHETVFKSFRIRRNCPNCAVDLYHWYDPKTKKAACSECGHVWHPRLRKDELT